jgi:hypothetical protein
VLTEDDVDQIVMKAAGDRRHGAAAARLEELADRPELHGAEVTRASLLVDAGGQHGLAGDWDAAIRCYRQAVADSDQPPRQAGGPQGHLGLDPRVWLHDALLRTGQLDEAAALLRDLKTNRSKDPDLYAAVAESLEAQGLLADAHTWFTMGYHRCQHAQVPDFMMDLLLVGRRRLRARLGYPVDDLDTLAEQRLSSSEG